VMNALQAIATVPYDTLERPASVKGLAARLWTETLRGRAVDELRNFDPKAWAGDAAVRVRTRKQLVLAGADAATLAKIDAI